MRLRLGAPTIDQIGWGAWMQGTPLFRKYRSVNSAVRIKARFMRQREIRFARYQISAAL